MAESSFRRDIYDEFVPYYDLFYADRQAEIDFYTSLLESAHRSVLELGCGTGRIVSALARSLVGRHDGRSSAVGLDRSLDMLGWARRRSSGVQWVQGDMAQPPLRGPYDLVFCALNTLQMLPSDRDVLRTFAAAYQLLAPAGVFVVDVYNPVFVESADAPVVPRLNHVVRSFKDSHGRAFEVREDAYDDSNGEWVRLDWRVRDLSVNPPGDRARLVVQLRHLVPGVLDTMLASSGLRVRDRYGDVRKSTFDQQQSKKYIVVCTR